MLSAQGGERQHVCKGGREVVQRMRNIRSIDHHPSFALAGLYLMKGGVDGTIKT